MPQLVPNQGSDSVDTSSEVVLKRVPYGMVRVAWNIQNTTTGSQTISVGDGKPAVSGEGEVLNPSEYTGESADSVKQAAELVSQNDISVVANAAGCTYAFYEKLVKTSR